MIVMHRVPVNRFCLLLVIAVSFPASARQLSPQIQGKLHPFFQSILRNSQTASLPRTGTLLRKSSKMIRQPSQTYDAIVYTNDRSAVTQAGLHVESSYGPFVTVQATIADIVLLANIPAVRYVDAGSVNYPASDVSVPEIGAALLQGGFINNTPYKGSGVIILIYDTGVDWQHLDFRSTSDTTKSRILAIWDQTLTPQNGETSPSGFSYGVEYTQAQVNNELDGSPANVVRERDYDGHGTHVAGTAAGNGGAIGKYTGVAPAADIIVVKGGDESFSETRMIDGLTYAEAKATQYGEPVVVNWSIGGQEGAHDGTSPYEVAVDEFVSNPGRVVCVAAGNSGEDEIHFSGSIASGSSATVTIIVPSYTPAPGTENDDFDIDIWFPSGLAINASVTSPDNVVFSGPGVAANQSDGTIELDNQVSPYNSHEEVELYVHDQTSSVPKSGTWTLTLASPSAATTFDGWIADESVGGYGISVPGANNSESVSMPATAQGAISAASYVTKWGWPTYNGLAYTYGSTDRTGNISTFSSIGPTADGRQKPDIAAPGQGVVAALSSTADTTDSYSIIVPGRKHWLLQGTSMATPHVAGTAALLLSVRPTLKASDIKALMTGSAVIDPYTGAQPNYTWGYGKLDALNAMVRNLNPAASASRAVLAYDGPTANQIVNLTGATKYAVRITPAISGRLTGLQVNLTTPANNPIAGSGSVVCEVYANSSGLPGTKIGSSVLFPLSQLSAATNNNIDMTAAGADLAASTDYHVVLSMANPSDKIVIRTDDGSAGTNRSSVYNGSQWLAFSNASSGFTGAAATANLRVRAVVTSLNGSASAGLLPLAPLAFRLDRNFPNPFNPSTSIGYAIPKQAHVRLRIFDLLGRAVATLVDREQPAGTYRVQWDGSDAVGRPVPSGVYFSRLESDGSSQSEKMLLLR